MPASVGLNMIVKNEAKTIVRCLDSCIKHVNAVHIVDTGSTDETVGMLESYALHHPEVPFTIGHCGFENFSQARNFALKGMRENHMVDYVLIMDADHEYVPCKDRKLFVYGEHDILEVEHQYGGMKYMKPVLLRLRKDLNWEGWVHETPIYFNPATKGRNEDFHVRVNTDGCRSQQADTDKFLHDADLLIQEYLLRPSPRGAFYIAQSYRDAGNHPEALRWYNRRAEMWGSWEEERWFAEWQAFRLGLLRVDANLTSVLTDALSVWGRRADRAEPLVAAASFFRYHGKLNLTMLLATSATKCRANGDTLFVDTASHGYKPWDELLVAAWHLGKKDVAHEAAHQLKVYVKNGKVPAQDLNRITENLRYF